MRLWQTVLFIILLTCTVLLAVAQTPVPWHIWLYSPSEGDLLEVNHLGEVVSSRRIPPVQHLAIQADKLAYTTEPSIPPQLVILSLTTNAPLATRPLPNPRIGTFNQDDQLTITPLAFDQTAQWLAYSVRIGGERWEIVVIKADDGTAQYGLSSDEALVHLFPQLHAGVMPHIQAVTTLNDQLDAVHFTIPNELGNPSPSARSYVWYPIPQTLYETVNYPTFGYNTVLPSGDALHALPDGRFFAYNDAFAKFPFLQNNTVQLSTVGGRFPIYANTESQIEQVFWVQNGERVLVQARFSATDARWILLDTSGAEVKRYTVASDTIEGVVDGFVYLTPVGDQTALVHVNTQNASSGTTVWVKEGTWQLLHTAPTDISEQAWIPLAEPQQGYLGAIAFATPTQYPTPFPMLRVGMEARIQTEKDHFLNLRDVPSTSGTVLALLESGTAVKIVGEPIEADGFIWWQIEVGNRVGWVVEAVDNIQALIPLRPLTLSPTATP